MARYIDADELSEEIKSLTVFLGGDSILNKTSKESVLRVIEEQPTADVVPVKHGEWIDNHNGTYTCSVCGGKASKMNWCGCCGAKMKGGEG